MASSAAEQGLGRSGMAGILPEQPCAVAAPLVRTPWVRRYGRLWTEATPVAAASVTAPERSMDPRSHSQAIPFQCPPPASPGAQLGWLAGGFNCAPGTNPALLCHSARKGAISSSAADLGIGIPVAARGGAPASVGVTGRARELASRCSALAVTVAAGSAEFDRFAPGCAAGGFVASRTDPIHR